MLNPTATCFQSGTHTVHKLTAAPSPRLISVHCWLVNASRYIGANVRLLAGCSRWMLAGGWQHTRYTSHTHTQGHTLAVLSYQYIVAFPTELITANRHPLHCVDWRQYVYVGVMLRYLQQVMSETVSTLTGLDYCLYETARRRHTDSPDLPLHHWLFVEQISSKRRTRTALHSLVSLTLMISSLATQPTDGQIIELPVECLTSFRHSSCLHSFRLVL